MERQYTASAYVIDYKNGTVLLMYNRKLEKWLQPGGHIEAEETPEKAAIREVKQETGIDIQIISKNAIDNSTVPIYIERYINKVGDMIDLQYLAMPLNKDLYSDENNQFGWFSLKELKQVDVAPDVLAKVEKLLKKD